MLDTEAIKPTGKKKKKLILSLERNCNGRRQEGGGEPCSLQKSTRPLPRNVKDLGMTVKWRTFHTWNLTKFSVQQLKIASETTQFFRIFRGNKFSGRKTRRISGTLFGAGGAPQTLADTLTRVFFVPLDPPYWGTLLTPWKVFLVLPMWGLSALYV